MCSRTTVRYRYHRKLSSNRPLDGTCLGFETFEELHKGSPEDPLIRPGWDNVFGVWSGVGLVNGDVACNLAER